MGNSQILRPQGTAREEPRVCGLRLVPPMLHLAQTDNRRVCLCDCKPVTRGHRTTDWG